jgi:hypothetical protein
MNDTRAKIGIAAVATVVLFAVLTLIFWDFMRDIVVTPLYRLLWVGNLLLKSLPQEIYLLVVIVISSIIGGSALQSLQSRPLVQNSPHPRSMENARYGFWLRLYEQLAGNHFSRNRFAMESRKLILSILAYQEGLDVSMVEARVMDDSMSVPNTVKYLIQYREIPTSTRIGTSNTSLRFWLRTRFIKPQRVVDPSIDQQVNEIVEFIEHRLEITYAGNPSQSPT